MIFAQCDIFYNRYQQEQEESKMNISTSRLALILAKVSGSTFKSKTEIKKVNSEMNQVESIAKKWLKNSRIRVKESSYIKYQNLLQNHILPAMGSLDFSELTTEYIGEFIRKKISTGRKDRLGGLSEKSVKDIISVLRSICSYAGQQGIDIPCHFELLKFRRTNDEVRILDRGECAILEKYLFHDNSLTKTGILLSLFMGLRLGEVCALRKENILYDDAILQVRFTMQRIQAEEQEDNRKTKIIMTPPKSTNSLRDIPIPKFILERLQILKPMPGETYVLTGSTDKFVEPRSMENIFDRCLRECQMEKINYHALRHTFATRCIEAGFDVKSLSEILGHANVNITLNRYVHSSMEQKRANMEKLQYRRNI